MIPLEKQVTSLELSKELKELGVKQDSLFAWYQYHNKVYCEYREYQASCDAQSTYQDGYAKLPVETCAAFTVAELGEMLPQYAESYRIATNKFSCKFCEVIEDTKGDPKNGEATIKVAHTEANARAKMLIYLIERREARKEQLSL